METTVDLTIQKIRDGLSPRANWFPPATTGYSAISRSYFWSSSRKDPLGILQPATVEDVAAILLNLAGAPDELTFAIKAGGHIAPTGFNATAGLLIDMSLFHNIHYDATTQLVEIGPGALYEAVYIYLAKHGRTVNGATSCPGVGVAGFNLGGGYGNKSNQYGLAMDTIQAIEVVLPTGQIKKVSAQQDPEIFRALKGGGNNFGIVTRWFMTTYEEKGFYFKSLNFEREHFKEVQKAIWSYIQKQDPKSNVETKFEWTTTTAGQTEPYAFSHTELFYDGKTPPAGLFAEFLDIDQIKERKQKSTWHGMMKHLPTRRQTYAGELANNLNDLPENFRGRYTHVMLSRYTQELIAYAVDRVEEVGNKLEENGGLQLYPDIWPGYPKMFENSPPSAWPRPPNKQPSFPLPIRCLWKGSQNDAFWLETLERLTNDIRTFAVQQGCTTKDAPAYYNLSLDGTNVEDIYRENLGPLSKLRGELDPHGVMDRTGGFRIPPIWVQK
ncbi:hypothetical protein BDZ94DRAFT_1311698 [Collybia nuda]|uniref:FAD-binding PCMH-type domain-containing protein n=1 Tax=Collybia nuda TaxID=64659 RepID=A0A9P6CGR5_9AGAR|nr:hypothetical protein BDZ94DRAFT_1311698 [Collybia nuda]